MRVDGKRQSLVEQIASHMEVGAELSFAYLSPSAGSLVRVHEFDHDAVYEWLSRSGHLEMVPTLPSQDLYLWMVDFAKNEIQGGLQHKLLNALSGVSAVWKFRNVLYHEDEAALQWEKFKRQKLMETARVWFESV
jgi:hypothetical protein